MCEHVQKVEDAGGELQPDVPRAPEVLLVAVRVMNLVKVLVLVAGRVPFRLTQTTVECLLGIFVLS